MCSDTAPRVLPACSLNFGRRRRRVTVITTQMTTQECSAGE